MKSRLIAISSLALAGSLILAVAAMLSGDSDGLGDAGEPRPGIGARPGGAAQVSEQTAARPDSPQAAISATQRDDLAQGEGRSAALISSSEIEGTGELSGEVRDASGRPLAGARLELTRTDVGAAFEELEVLLGPNEYPVRQATSDPQGRYSFSGLAPADNYRLEISHDDYARKQLGGLRVLLDGVTQRDVELGEGFVIEGLVTDLEREPIEGARLTLLSQAAADLPADRTPTGTSSLYSNARGAFRFTGVSQGLYAVRVDLEGYATMIRGHIDVRGPQRGRPVRSTRVPFRLENETLLSGRVVDADGRGLAGVVVEARFERPALSNRGYGMSDAQGRFTLRGLAPVEFSLSARLDGYLDHREEGVPHGVADHMVTLVALGRAAGRASRAADGAPLQQFRARLRRNSGTTQQPGAPFAEREFESETGYFEFGGLAEGEYVVEVLAAGLAPAQSAPFAGGPGQSFGEADVSLGPGARILGRVIDSATREPIEGALLRTMDSGRGESPLTALGLHTQARETTDARTRSGSDGSFVLDGLAGGRYRLLIADPRYPQRAVDGLLLTEGSDEKLGDLVLHAGAAIFGTVRDSAGRGVPRADVQLVGTASASTAGVGGSFKARCDENGRYRLENLPAGNFQLSASRPASGVGLDSVLGMAASTVPVTLSSGSESERDLYLRDG